MDLKGSLNLERQKLILQYAENAVIDVTTPDQFPRTVSKAIGESDNLVVHCRP